MDIILQQLVAEARGQLLKALHARIVLSGTFPDGVPRQRESAMLTGDLESLLQRHKRSRQRPLKLSRPYPPTSTRTCEQRHRVFARLESPTSGSTDANNREAQEAGHMRFEGLLSTNTSCLPSGIDRHRPTPRPRQNGSRKNNPSIMNSATPVVRLNSMTKGCHGIVAAKLESNI